MRKGRRLSKMLTLCFCVLLLGHFSFIASSAKEAEVRMASIADYGTNLVISDDGIASVSGWVTGKTEVTSTYVKVTLQKSILGIWVNVESWEDSSDVRSASVNVACEVSRGTYRTVMTCSADEETETATSVSRKY